MCFPYKTDGIEKQRALKQANESFNHSLSKCAVGIAWRNIGDKGCVNGKQ